jgi:uncharacterized protein
MDQSPNQPVAPVAAPVAQIDRLPSLDLLRGIAVLGILLANITAFAHVDLAYHWPPALPGGGTEVDRMVWLAQFVLVDGKLRGLFTLLFGAGLVLFIERAGGEERAIFLQLRRLGWLALFGALHFYLLFRGDILFGYACGGLVALMFVRLSGERLLALGLIWALVGGAFQVLAYLTPALIELGSDPAAANVMGYYREYWQGQLAEAAEQATLMTGGSYGEILRYRVVEESSLLANYARYALFETIPLMLLGMGLYRCGIYAPAEGRTPACALAWGAVVAGLALNLGLGLWVWSHGFGPFTTMLAFFGVANLTNLPLLLGGTWLLAHWAARPHDSWLAERLGQAGRMALSNYVGTSLVMVLLFHGWAGGLFGQLGRLELLVVVVLGWLLMLRFSHLWLARYRQGPFEWLWRCLTYWRRFPLRRGTE